MCILSVLYQNYLCYIIIMLLRHIAETCCSLRYDIVYVKDITETNRLYVLDETERVIIIIKSGKSRILWCILLYVCTVYIRVFVSSFIMQSHAINGYFPNKVINTVFFLLFLRRRRRRAHNFIILYYLFCVRINERDCVRSGEGERGINIIIIRRLQSDLLGER